MLMVVLLFLITALGQYERLEPLLWYPFSAEVAAPIMTALSLFFGMLLMGLATAMFTRSHDKELVLRAYRKAMKEREKHGVGADQALPDTAGEGG